MFRAIYDWVASLLSTTRELDQLRIQVRELRRDQLEQEKDILTFRLEMQAALARETAEREKFMLQVQNLLLQWEKRLPQPVGKPPEKRRKRVKRGG
ncbi:MAG: hypothetical protein HZA92_13370 [Verrucomicrobia bacterium]|nr:hypothetical protein [Verrucomicrobiota bacterium]